MAVELFPASLVTCSRKVSNRVLFSVWCFEI